LPDATRRFVSAFRARPLVLPAVALGLGILADAFPGLPSWAWAVWLAGVIASFLAAWRVAGSMSRSSVFAVPLLCLFFGGFLHNVRSGGPADSDICHLIERPRQIAILEATIKDAPVIERASEASPETGQWYSSTRFTVEVHRAWNGAGWQALSGRVRVKVRDAVESVRYGDRVTLYGKLSPVLGPSNPGQFDARGYLERKGIRARLSVPGAAGVVIATRAPWWDAAAALEGLRAGAARRIGDCFDSETAAVLDCLLLGMRAQLPQDIRDLFQRSGTFHFLVVSGLHIATFAFFIWLVFGLFGASHRTSSVATIVAILAYVPLSGMGLPAIRAGIIALAFAASAFIHRRTDILNVLALTALVLLIADPNELFSAGFQLSFGAILGILAFAGPISRFLWLPFSPKDDDGRLFTGPAVKRILDIAAATTAATLVIAPILAWNFNFFAPVTLLANVLIFPLVFAALLGGLLFLLAGTFAPVGFVLTSVLDWVVSLILWLERLLGNVPCGVVFGSRPRVWWLICYYAFVVALAATRRASRKVQLLAAAAFTIFVVPSIAVWQLDKPGQFEWSVLDVGQGSASYVNIPDGGRILFDCGSMSFSSVGSSVVAPFLWTRDVRRIDHVFLSHAHADHINGIGDILTRFRVGSLYVPEDFAEHPGGRRVLALAADRGANVTTVKDGFALDLGGEAAAGVLCLAGGAPGSEPLDPNKGSLALRVRYRGHTFLLCGDNDGESLDHILADGTAYDAVLVPHHGSSRSGGDRFFEDVRTRWAFLSATSIFPNEEGREVLESRGITLECTDSAGALTVKAEGDELEFSGFLPDGRSVK